MSMVNDLNIFLMDNIYVVALALFITVLALWLMGEPRGRTVGKISLGVGTFSIVYVLLGLILIIGAGSTVVIGNWMVYGTTPRGTLQWGLVFYAMFLILAYSTGFFATTTKSRRRSKN